MDHRLWIMDCRYRYGKKSIILRNAAVSHPASLPGTYATLQFPQPDNAGSTWFYPSKQLSAWVVSSKNVVYPPNLNLVHGKKWWWCELRGDPIFKQNNISEHWVKFVLCDGFDQIHLSPVAWKCWFKKWVLEIGDGWWQLWQLSLNIP